MKQRSIRGKSPEVRFWLFPGSLLLVLVFGTAGCQSGAAAIGTSPAPDEVVAARPLGPSGKDTRLSGSTERLWEELLRLSPFVRRAICAVWANVDDAWDARDAQRFSRLFTDDVSLGFVQRDLLLEGRRAVHEHFRKQLSSLAPDLRQRTQISGIRAVATGALTVDGKVEILGHGVGGDRLPAVLKTFSIFAVMSGNDEDWSSRTLRIYELSLVATGTRTFERGSCRSMPERDFKASEYLLG